MSFPGEAFLQAPLPDYEGERFRITIYLIVAAVFWIAVFPLLSVASSASAANSTKARNAQAKAKAVQNKAPLQSSSAPPPEIPLSTTVYSVIGLLVSVLSIMLYLSPHNYYTSRRVFQAPLLTAEECDRVIAMSEAAAARNFEIAQHQTDEDMVVPEDATPDQIRLADRANRTRNALLQEPTGWQKTRHNSYPTTDLNLVTDPFSPQDREWLSSILSRRLSTQLARFYGLTPQSIRANDMFVVRYDEGRRTHLANHTDDSDISFNVLLNEDFEGGGTVFWNRVTETPFAHVHPTRKGEFLTHSALINHEGYHVSKGTRIILVGFLSVDRVDPFSGRSNGLSWFATWGNWAWLHSKFKEAYFIRMDRLADKKPTDTGSWTEHPYVQQLLVDLVNVLQATGDIFGTHAVEQVVAPENTNQYLQALDQAPPPAFGSSWFKGQQLKVDMDGSIEGEWMSRKANQKAFEEL